ncbi:helix-turn-helix domain-containing protein [Actinomyces culturomici]|uniref:helix-turn-helix domain-containing protein n=1 Tax=Actinomyces culturomici TaxID=1926276 RepID=UPI001359553B|nr:helix-turn-helix domain-containing protein [Actinomyces culturomici]
MNPSTGPDFYSLARLADVLDVNPRTLRRMVDRGELEAVRIGRAIRIPGRELRRLGYTPKDAA